MISAHPEAEVVILERDIEKWYTSFDHAVIKPMWTKWGKLIADLDPWFVGPLRDVHLRWVKDWMGVHSEDDMRMKAKEKYKEHYKLLRSTVSKERLLEYQLGSGWRPLCDFLGKDVPGVEFPRVNETASMHEKIFIIGRRGLANLLIRVALWVGSLMVAGLLMMARCR